MNILRHTTLSYYTKLSFTKTLYPSCMKEMPELKFKQECIQKIANKYYKLGKPFDLLTIKDTCICIW